MKELSLYVFLALTGLLMSACDESFSDWKSPQFYPQESAITVPGLTASAQSAATIDLASAGDAVKVLSLSEATLPAGAKLDHLRMVVSPVGIDAEPVTIQALDAEGNFSKEELQKVVTDYYGRAPEARMLNAKVYLDLVNGEQSSYVDAGAIVILLTPIAPQISQNYYIVGGTLDWAGSAASKEQKFNHSDKNVYDDPIFTIVINAAEGDTWFAIGDDEACDAIANNEEGAWSKLLGTTKGNGNTDLTGTLARRYDLSDDGSFCVPAGYKKIKVTLDMMAYTYTIEPVNIAENYYLIGGPGNWDSSKNQKFSHSDKDVFEDPVFTYVFEGSGSEMWFAFGDDEAIDAVGEGVWNKLYGTKGESTDLTGSFDRRYNLDGDHSFCVDGQAKLYRFSINMAEMTYEITPLNFLEYIYEAGVNNSWGEYLQPLYCSDGTGLYTGFFYAQEDSWTEGKGAFKFRGAADGWDNGNYGTGTLNDDGLTGTLIDDGGSGNIMPAPGFYRADVNLANMTYTLTPINSVYVVGSALNNDWDNGVQMTFNTAKHCWECDATFTEAGVIKFKGNGTWDSQDGNWGGTMNNIINGSNDNIPVTLSGDVHIEFYPLCDTKSYCTITAK